MSLGKMAGIFTCKQLLALSSEQNVDGYRKTYMMLTLSFIE